MSKVTETRTQDDLREAITPLNLGNYLHDLEQHAKQTGQLEDLKINYVLTEQYTVCHCAKPSRASQSS